MVNAPIIVTAAIIQHADLFLICQRPPGKHLAGFWEFPGGKLEYQEKPETGLYRELKEELNIETNIGPLLHQTTFQYPDKYIQLLFYSVSIIIGEPQAREHMAIAWVSQKDFPNYVFAPADREVLLILKDLLGKD